MLIQQAGAPLYL